MNKNNPTVAVRFHTNKTIRAGVVVKPGDEATLTFRGRGVSYILTLANGAKACVSAREAAWFRAGVC